MSIESIKKIAPGTDKEFLLKLGAELKKIREEKGLKQADVAAAISMQRSYISEVETAKYCPTIETLRKLSCVYEVKMHEILARIE